MKMKAKHFRIHQREDMLFEIQELKWLFFWKRIGERLFHEKSEARKWIRENLILARPIVINQNGDVIYHGY